MVLCLGLVTLLCGALLGGAFVLTQDKIALSEAENTRRAIAAVLPAFDALSELQGSGDDTYYIARNAQGDTVGFAVNASSGSGFGGPIRLMVGFYADGRICNTAVLSQSETPGLGAKCTEEQFASQFRGFDPSQKLLKARRKGGSEGDIDAITAATITSRAYCEAVASAVKVFAAINTKEEQSYE